MFKLLNIRVLGALIFSAVIFAAMGCGGKKEVKNVYYEERPATRTVEVERVHDDHRRVAGTRTEIIVEHEHENHHDRDHDHDHR